MKKEERKDYFAPTIKEVKLSLEQAILYVSGQATDPEEGENEE